MSVVLERLTVGGRADGIWPRPPLHYPDEPLHMFLRRAAERFPEHTALRFEEEAFTYRELDAWGTCCANALRGLGIGQGDRVLLAMGNRSEWFLAQHGVSQAGAASVLANPSWKRDEIRHALELTRPEAVLADRAVAEVVESTGLPVARRVCVDDDGPAGWTGLGDLLAGVGGARPPDLTGDLSRLEALLPFSSGTTGLPKAVRHTHRSLSAAIRQRMSAYRMSESDRVQFFMALCTIYGVMVSLSTFAAGSSLRLFRRFDAELVLQNLHDERITIAFGAAPVAVAFRDRPDLERYDLSSLRYMMWGATPVLPDVAAEVSRRSGIHWMQAYSTTEVGIASNPVERLDACRLDSPGLPLSDVEIRIVDLTSLDDVPPGGEGEVVVRGPSIMLGYLPEAENEAAFLPGGWFRTGDVGWMEAGGWLHLTDRVKEMMKVSGFQVAPAEIEQTLFAHPGVADCAVYGVPDRRRGEAPKAAVVATPGDPPSAEELMSFVAERLAGYKHLSAVAFVREIPRNTGGKVLRRLLREADPEVATAPAGSQPGT